MDYFIQHESLAVDFIAGSATLHAAFCICSRVHAARTADWSTMDKVFEIGVSERIMQRIVKDVKENGHVHSVHGNSGMSRRKGPTFEASAWLMNYAK